MPWERNAWSTGKILVHDEATALEVQTTNWTSSRPVQGACRAFGFQLQCPS